MVFIFHSVVFIFHSVWVGDGLTATPLDFPGAFAFDNRIETFPNFAVPQAIERPWWYSMVPILRLLSAAAGSDQDLLNRYTRDRDDAAFEALVQRYGAGVWAACRRLAGGDADDAFQAVFLTLSRKAGTVTGSLPAWLHAVARRVASTLRRSARRRAAVERAAARLDRAPAESGFHEGLARLDEELARLPERYRSVLIVCCLEGHSRDEAAAQLGWTEGQVKGRLERAREMLRARLARRGIELGGVLLAAAISGPAPARIAPSPAILSLTHGVVRDMAIQKYRLAAAVLAAAVVGIGVLLANSSNDPEKPPPPRNEGEELAKGWEFVGGTQAAAVVDVRARVAGYLTKVVVKNGAAVKKGDVLAEILARPYQLDLEAAQARANVAKARLQSAALKAADARSLYQKHVIGQTTLDLTKAEEAEAEAGVAVANVEVQRARMNMDLTHVMTPIDGRVSRIQTTEGNLIVADQTVIMTIVADDRLHVSFKVPERLYLQLRRDGLTEANKLRATVAFAGEEGYPHAAKMVEIEPEADPKTGTVQFRTTVLNPKGILLPGMSARIRLAPSTP